MNYMLGFDHNHNLYVTKNIILVITGNISLIIIINTVDIMQRFNGYNMFHQDQFLPHIFYYN